MPLPDLMGDGSTIQIPGGALFGAGDSPVPAPAPQPEPQPSPHPHSTPRLPDVNARPSVLRDGSDLPFHDIETLRFLYNLGLQTYNTVKKSVHNPALAMYGFEQPRAQIRSPDIAMSCRYPDPGSQRHERSRT